MADFDSSRFSLLSNVQDDSKFVHLAMYTLGFVCEFGELSTDQMQAALSLAEHFKRAQSTSDQWES
jgi:hypothetical protein